MIWWFVFAYTFTVLLALLNYIRWRSPELRLIFLGTVFSGQVQVTYFLIPEYLPNSSIFVVVSYLGNLLLIIAILRMRASYDYTVLNYAIIFQTFALGRIFTNELIPSTITNVEIINGLLITASAIFIYYLIAKIDLEKLNLEWRWFIFFQILSLGIAITEYLIAQEVILLFLYPISISLIPLLIKLYKDPLAGIESNLGVDTLLVLDDQGVHDYVYRNVVDRTNLDLVPILLDRVNQSHNVEVVMDADIGELHVLVLKKYGKLLMLIIELMPTSLRFILLKFMKDISLGRDVGWFEKKFIVGRE